MSEYMVDQGLPTISADGHIDMRCTRAALALSAALAGRLSKEKMQKITAVHRINYTNGEVKALVKVKVTPAGNPLELTEPYQEFPSETMLAQIMLVV